MSRAPALAEVLANALGSSVSPETQRCYDSGTNKYLKFCSIHSIDPFEVDPVWLSLFIVVTAMCVSVPTLKVYLSAIRSAQIDAGFEWTLSGNPVVTRALRYVRRRYGEQGKALKIPISTATLLKMVSKIDCWPHPL